MAAAQVITPGQVSGPVDIRAEQPRQDLPIIPPSGAGRDSITLSGSE
ncbi:hypothetical protein MNQ95_07340 [Pseudoxanthomonas daejeonensis]|nr:hypothetical protein [Pseudoxanthomonas daejeonensis]UNK58880.1 hypothetical protein MNQ95_07340 [Pseudoxanthomonas daejeonensis]